MSTNASTPLKLAESKVVLFVDLLGFACLTEQHSLELDRIKQSHTPLLNLEMIIGSPPANPLTHAFTRFHQSLKWKIEFAQMSHTLTAITFSDSAFIATTYLFEAVKIAVDLVQSLLTQRVPMRVGIGYGSFSVVRFRSDVTLDGGDHAAHFLGTAVVRSHGAETCGVKGLRILLHPSAALLLNDPAHNPSSSEERIRYLECSEAERNNTVNVRYEIDYWRMRPTAEVKAWHALQDMWTIAPQEAVNHYEATAEAINRMRIGQGQAPLNKLRRRTLPRRDSPAL
jgi:hypothetical protein